MFTTLNDPTLIYLIPLIMYVLVHIGLYRVFEKAGFAGWKALIPFYSTIICLEIIKKPKWWFIFYLMPFVNLILNMVVLVELAKCFGRYKFSDYLLAVLAAPLYFIYIAFFSKDEYIGIEPSYKIRKSKTREWVDAIAFAVIAATVIRSFLIEAYTIPTPSMEETLLVDDFLFVSKLNYGARVPMTPLAFPLAHNTMPLIGGKSYIGWLSLPYIRFWGWEKIENGDIVVFNWPADRDRPVDKKDNYIKRCIGIPGDSLKIDSTQVYLNGKKFPLPPHSQMRYIITVDNNFYPEAEVLSSLGITSEDMKYDVMSPPGAHIWMLTEDAVRVVKLMAGVKSVTLAYNTDPTPFPSDSAGLGSTWDNYGTIYLPKRGDVISLNTKTYSIYNKAIREYENNPTLEMRNGIAYLDGKILKEYKFKLNYYFMMGDNRYNSADSREWGFVPEDHIVGKPLFIWLSLNSQGNWLHKIRWSRMFTGIH